MRGLAFVALLLVGALVLSGCSSKDSDSTSSSTSGSPTGTKTGTGTGVKTNTTTQAPNVPPVIKLSVSNTNNTATNVTLVGGSLVFSAAGSTDPDGDGLSAVAIVAQDANRTFPPGVLYAAGKFTPVTYTFDRAGVVNVTVSGIDVRGDLTTVKAQVYVNQVVTVKSNTLNVPAGVETSASDCKGPTGQAVADAFLYDFAPFTVQKGATFLEGDKTAESAGEPRFAFCFKKADGTASAVSADDTDGHAVSNVPLVAPTGLDTYGVGFVAEAPQTTGYVKVIIHYEPMPAAAA